MLGRIRNLAAFHYKDATFPDGVAQLTQDTELVIAEWAGFSRYAITDAILERKVVEAGGGTPATLEAALGKALDVADALETVVRELAHRVVEARENAVTMEPVETMPVPPALHTEARKRLRGATPQE